MNRKTLIAGVLFAGLVLVAIALLRSPEKGNRPASGGPRPVAKLKAGDFDTLEVTKGTQTTTIVKRGDGYEVTAPLAYPADKDGAKAAFEAMEKLDFGTIITDQQSRHGEFEVADKSLRVVVKQGAQVLADLRVGKSTNDQTMMRAEGKNEVWSAPGFRKFQVDKDATAWRDKSIASFDEKEAERIEINSKTGGKIVLTRPAATDAGTPPEWSVAESTIKIPSYDKTIAPGVVSLMSSWKANDFADSAKPEDTGLDAPENTVTVGLKGGKQVKVLVGKKKGEDETYVRLADKPQVFLVKKFNLERMNKRPIEFRDKTLCNLQSAEITEISVARDKDPFVLAHVPGKSDDQAWKLIKPAGAAPDTSKANTISGAFADWKAQSFAEDNSPKTTGLAKPGTVITVKSNVKGHGCTVQVGQETSDKSNYYVTSNGQPDVLVTSKWSVDRIAVKLDELKKK